MATKTVRNRGVYIPDSIAAELAARGDNRSGIISRDLERLYALYVRALKESQLTLPEACLIVDLLNATIMDASTARMLWAEVEDGIKLDGLAEKWSVDGPALVAKIKALNDIQSLALVDAAERFWVRHDEGELKEIVKQVFLLKGGK